MAEEKAEEKREGIPRVLLFGGTTEGLRILGFLQRFDLDLTVSVATQYGRESIRENAKARVVCGRMDKDEMLAWIEKNSVELVIDATHPFATEATRNIQWACKAGRAEYIRCLRKETDPARPAETQAVYVDSVQEAVEYLKRTEGNILITTGSKELGRFCEIPDYQTRCFARVLSVTDSVKSSVECGFVGRNLIAMRAPFSKEMNIATIHYADAAFFVTKESGDAGGMREKTEACSETGTTLVVIRRPEEVGSHVEELCKALAKKYEKFRLTV